MADRLSVLLDLSQQYRGNGAPRNFRRFARRFLERQVRIGHVAEKDVPALVRLAELWFHLGIFGMTRAGKTRWQARMAVTSTLLGAQLLVLDFKGDLSTLTYKWMQMLGMADGCLHIDPYAVEHTGAVPSNLLVPPKGVHPDAWIPSVVDNVLAAFGESDSEHRPWIELYMLLCLAALASAGLTAVELPELAAEGNENFRSNVLSFAAQKTSLLQRAFHELQQLPPQERARALHGVRTRGLRIALDPYLRLFYGQTEAIQPADLIAEGRHVIYNLGPRPGLDRKQIVLYAATELNRWLRALQDKPLDHPLIIAIDEYQMLPPSVLRAIGQALCTLQGFNVSFWLSSQSPLLIYQRCEELWESMMTNCNRVLFANSAIGLKTLIEDMYVGTFDSREIKDEIVSTKFRPETVWREIVTYSEGHGEGSVESMLSSNAHALGASSTMIDGLEASASQMSNFIQGSGTGHASSMSSFEGVSRTKAPGIEHKEFKEVSSRTFFHESEQLSRELARVAHQSPRHFVWYARGQSPLHVVSDTFDDPIVDDLCFDLLGTESNARPSFKKPNEIMEEIRKRFEMWNSHQPGATPLREPLRFLVPGRAKVK